MTTTFKSFQISILFHLVLGALFVSAIPNNDKVESLEYQDKIRINLIGFKTGPRSGQNSNSVKNSISETSNAHTDSRIKFSDKVIENRSASSGTSLSGGATEAIGSGEAGGGSNDFNESILSFYEPQYPKAALRRGLQGTLKLKILIGNQGIPIEAQILKSSGHKILDDSALEAVSKWVFKKNNSAYYVVKTVIFQIKN